MLLQIDPQTKTATFVQETEMKKCPLISALGRARDEFESWKEYKQMAETDERYAVPTMQEFQHGLLALNDILKQITLLATPQELDELQRFITAAVLAKPE